MKTNLLFIVLLTAGICFYCHNAEAQIWKRVANKAQQTLDDRTVEKAGDISNKAFDKTIESGEKSVESNTNTNGQSHNDPPKTTTTTSITSYQNYDFVPGDKVLYSDDFTRDQDGEFPAHWTLTKGQAVVNKVADKNAFLLTDGNYCQVYPRMKTKSYLTDPFTVEFDYYANEGSGPNVSFAFKDKDGNDEEGYLSFSNTGEISTFEIPVDFNATCPGANSENFGNKWHHAALIYKNNQVKCYIDQYRVLVIPQLSVIPTSLGFAGIGDHTNPIIFTNVRIASGGKMNMIGKKFTGTKIVTHGITFDIDKSNIKPQSMGTINMIVGVLKSNPSLRFEIEGHTDNTGGAAHNLALSQQRAETVKAQLVAMGINAGRLTTRGFGDTKPIADNTTIEGRANNRRVEFVKQ